MNMLEYHCRFLLTTEITYFTVTPKKQKMESVSVISCEDNVITPSTKYYKKGCSFSKVNNLPYRIK